MKYEYCIADPTGNITALVKGTDFSEEEYKLINREIMEKHPEVEQVGFCDFSKEKPFLRMAGGEFCGNAAMSTGALFCKEKGIDKAELEIEVFGCDAAFRLWIEKESERYSTSIEIPKPKSIQKLDFEIDGRVFRFPIVHLSGISHIIADTSIDPLLAPELLRKYCDILNLPAIGIMILNGNAMDPIVYVKSCDTMFFENSCASGSCAVGAYLTRESVSPQKIDLIQRGGVLSVESSGDSDNIRLFGYVSIFDY